MNESLKVKGWMIMRLYRIISLETFIDILHNKRERYVRPSKWKDIFEGYLFSKIYDKDEQRKIIEDFYYNVCVRNYKGTINNMLNLEHSKWFVYGQCWSKLAESDAMWRIYSYGNHSIQIQTTDQRIRNLFKTVDGVEFDIKSVKYDVNPDEDLSHVQIQQLKQTQNIYEPYLHKRKAFKHESEVRVLIDDIKWYQMTQMNSMGANWNIFETMSKLTDDEDIIDEIVNRLDNYLNKWATGKLPNEYYIEDIDLKKYISSVVVNPFAEDWYVQLIEDLCSEYEIKCKGKSQLYKKRQDK